jgi:hypothetical protein
MTTRPSLRAKFKTGEGGKPAIYMTGRLTRKGPSGAEVFVAFTPMGTPPPASN